METRVTTTTTATTATVGPTINVNHMYYCTPPGIIKLVQILFGIICMACASPVLTNYTHFFMFVVASCFLGTVLLCLFYLFSIQDLVPSVPWLLLELSFTAGAVFLYTIAFIVQLAMTSSSDYYYRLKLHGFVHAYFTAGSFGLFNTIAYGAGLFFLYQDWRQQRQVVN